MGMRMGGEICERYRRDISRCERISEEREEALSRIIQKGRSVRKVEAAIQELVESNLFLVLHCAHDFDTFLASSAVRITRMDLIAEGNIALLIAARHYNTDYCSSVARKRVRFAGYACGIIRNRMRRAIKMARIIHIPEQHFSYWGQMRRLERDYGEKLTDDILMEEMGVGESKLKKLHGSIGVDVSMLEDMACAEGISRWSETMADANAVSPESEADRRDMNEFLRREMDRLPKRTRAMISQVYLSDEGASLGDLSKRFGVSRERCRQVLAKGLKTLRRNLEGRCERTVMRTSVAWSN